jgi:hypothetical protein
VNSLKHSFGALVLALTLAHSVFAGVIHTPGAQPPPPPGEPSVPQNIGESDTDDVADPLTTFVYELLQAAAVMF